MIALPLQFADVLIPNFADLLRIRGFFVAVSALPYRIVFVGPPPLGEAAADPGELRERLAAVHFLAEFGAVGFQLVDKFTHCSFIDNFLVSVACLALLDQTNFGRSGLPATLSVGSLAPLRRKDFPVGAGVYEAQVAPLGLALGGFGLEEYLFFLLLRRLAFGQGLHLRDVQSRL